MIYKSYLVEKDIDLLKNNLILFYGENIGLINEFKKILKEKNKTYSVVRITEDSILHLAKIYKLDKNIRVQPLKTKDLTLRVSKLFKNHP